MFIILISLFCFLEATDHANAKQIRHSELTVKINGGIGSALCGTISILAGNKADVEVIGINVPFERKIKMGTGVSISVDFHEIRSRGRGFSVQILDENGVVLKEQTSVNDPYSELYGRISLLFRQK
jgi:hypothetical protein